MKLNDIETRGCNRIYVLTWGHGTFSFKSAFEKYGDCEVSEIHICDGIVYVILKREN